MINAQYRQGVKWGREEEIEEPTAYSAGCGGAAQDLDQGKKGWLVMPIRDPSPFSGWQDSPVVHLRVHAENMLAGR